MKIDTADIAESELAAAYDYYFDISPDLAWRFLVEYRETIESILDMPETWLKFDDKHHRKSLDGFPYAVIYELHNSDHLTIISVFNHYREPRRFPKRDL